MLYFLIIIWFFGTSKIGFKVELFTNEPSPIVLVSEHFRGFQGFEKLNLSVIKICNYSCIHPLFKNYSLRVKKDLQNKTWKGSESVVKRDFPFQIFQWIFQWRKKDQDVFRFSQFKYVRSPVLHRVREK